MTEAINNIKRALTEVESLPWQYIELGRNIEHDAIRNSSGQTVFGISSYQQENVEFLLLAVNNIDSIITIIESQQQELSGFMDIINEKIPHPGKAYWDWKTGEDRKSLISQIESQKEEIESLKWKIAHPVFCQGICTSQRDDYSGYHMSNEDCRACNSIWTNAHVENAMFNQKAITELAVKGLKEVIQATSKDNSQISDAAHYKACNALEKIERLSRA